MTRASILSSREEFVRLVDASSSMREMLVNAGLRAAGGNYGALRKWSAIHKITLPVGSSSTSQAQQANTKWTADKVFVVESQATRNRTKLLAIRHNLIPYVCATPDCGIVDTWLGKEIVLQLEHKNGIYNDNRLENLEFLCPNCHTQTKTYAGRNSTNLIRS